MTVAQRENVCNQLFDHLNATISRTSGEARAEIPDWFESTDLGDGNHRVRFCCEPRAWKDPIDELDRLTSQWAESLWADDDHLVDNVNYIKKRLARDYNKKVKKGFAKTEALEFPIDESANDCEKAGAFTKALKDWSSVHNYNYHRKLDKKHQKLVAEIENLMDELEFAHCL